MTEKVTALQGTQPEISGVLVGIMRVGRPDGIGVARLALRNPGGSRIELIREGGSVPLFDQGTLTLARVHEPGQEFPGGAVVLEFIPREAEA